jgi:hypothetical protein
MKDLLAIARLAILRATVCLAEMFAGGWWWAKKVVGVGVWCYCTGSSIAGQSLVRSDIDHRPSNTRDGRCAVDVCIR